MSVWLSAGLAGAAIGCLLLPGHGTVRVAALLPVGGADPESSGSLGVGAGRASVGATRPSRPLVLVTLAGAMLLAVGVGPVPAALAAGGTGLGRAWWRRRQDAARRKAERDRFVEACATLAAELRAGRSPAEALAAAAGLAIARSGEALAAAACTARLGGDVAAALAPEPAAVVGEVQRALAACWSVCASSGGGLAAAVERLTDGLRGDAEQRRAVDAELAGPRATAGLLALLPAAGIVLATGLGADPLHVLLFTPVGLVCLVAGLVLDGLGVFWTSRLVARAGGAT